MALTVERISSVCFSFRFSLIRLPDIACRKALSFTGELFSFFLFSRDKAFGSCAGDGHQMCSGRSMVVEA